MLKFVALCALVAAASAEPGLIAPLTYSTSVVAPGPAVYSSYPSSVVYSPSIAAAPVAYSTPYGYSHFIKKRSVALPVSSYVASPYLASAPLVSSWNGAYTTPLATTYAGPLAYSSPVYTTAHLIKKRSAPFIVPSTYVASSPYVAPFVASTYAAATPVVSTPYVSTAPFGYAHFIKKRSAPLVAAYTAPVSYSHQSRFDYQATSPAITTYSTYSSPLVYPTAVGVNHLI